MKLALFTRRTSKFPTHSQSTLIRNVLGFSWYSTEILNKKRNCQEESLYRRISPVGKPNDSVVPVLDQWIEEGRHVNQRQLRDMIKELRHYRRYKHALEISQWMSDKRYMHPSVSDVAVRLDLIARVHGIEQAENYFNNTPKQLRTLEVYGALLSCCSHGKCVDKAEAVMQKMREMGFASTTLSYNVLLNLYYQTGNNEKVDTLIHEMEAKQINFDRYTYGILMNALGDDADIKKIEKTLMKMESDPELNMDWLTYADVASRYLRAGSIEKAMNILRKSEKLIDFAKKKNEAFSYLLTVYAGAGKKEEVLRVWNKCKKFKVCNRDYMCMLSSILKFNDLETAEKVFKEWETSDLHKDIRIPNFLISTYCKKGMMDKAEALIERAREKNWQKPKAVTWAWMSMGYVQSNQMAKAVKAMESAALDHIPGSRWEPDKETLKACLDYLKEEGDAERFGSFERLLKDKGIIDPVKIVER